MWAWRLSAPGRLAPVEVPTPKSDDLAAGEVLLRTLAGGICGSDRPKFHGQKDTAAGWPRPVGYPLHEVVGEVCASRQPQLAEGQRVVGWATRSNALAEYVVTDGSGLAPYSPRLQPEQAVLIQPIACALHALDAVPVTGHSVAVLGLGPMGLLLSHVLATAGATRVTGVDPIARVNQSSAFGITDIVSATSETWARSLLDAERPDVVVEAVGHQVATLQHAVEACAVDGRIMYFGIPDEEIYPINMELLVRKNLTLSAGVTRNRRTMLAHAEKYLRAHSDTLLRLVTHRLPMRQAHRAFELAAPGPGRGKIVLTCP